MRDTRIMSGPLQVEISHDGITATMLRLYRVKISDDEYGWQVIDVPVGFVTDFASVPRALWSIFPPWGPYSPAAVVHDYLYTFEATTRRDADRVLLKLMKILGVPLWKRKAIYFAVRAFGWSHWKKKKDGYEENKAPTS